MQWGDRIDYANVRSGRRVQLNPEAGIALGKPLRLYLTHTFERMAVASVRLCTAHISQVRCLYHFKVRSYLRTTLQSMPYNCHTANSLVEQDPRFERFSTQLLFSCNPFTAFSWDTATNSPPTKSLV